MVEQLCSRCTNHCRRQKLQYKNLTFCRNFTEITVDKYTRSISIKMIIWCIIMVVIFIGIILSKHGW